MRPVRTPDEQRILKRLPSVVGSHGITLPIAYDTTVTDCPDAVVCHASGRIGIEISRLDYEEFCQWAAVKPKPPYARAAEVEINLKKMLGGALLRKSKKYDVYRAKT